MKTKSLARPARPFAEPREVLGGLKAQPPLHWLR
jgi:hypothetical protein